MHQERDERSEKRANDEPVTPMPEPESSATAMPTPESGAVESTASAAATAESAASFAEPEPLHALQPDSIPATLLRSTTPESGEETKPPAGTETNTTNENAAEAPTDDATHDTTEELWLDGENFTTLFLRSICTLLAGGFLAWAQYNAPLQPGAEWGRWVWTSVIANFLLPLFVVWMFFAQQLRPAEWLQDQKFNAWNYGWNFREWRWHGKQALLMFAVMLPFIWWASRDPGARAYYATYFPPVTGAGSWFYLLGTLTLYMFCWEWFNRGFLLFGMAQGFGPWLAILLQAAIFAASHYGKPQAEFIGAFGGGLVLGTISWREKSFAPAFYTHALVHVAWALLVLH